MCVIGGEVDNVDRGLEGSTLRCEVDTEGVREVGSMEVNGRS